jgi:uncharacterized cupin superfamily protein
MPLHCSDTAVRQPGDEGKCDGFGTIRTRSRSVSRGRPWLTQFGANLVRLPPGKWSSQRHWHTDEDEFVWMLEGEVTLVEDPLAEDGGAKVLTAGDCAGWKAGTQNGHCLQNRSGRDAVYLEVGSRRPETDACDYPDIDMVAKPGEPFYRHRDGTPYPPGDK